ncbi:HPP family protein [Pseudoalteromonas umbrosa]|uniref:CBS domain-containing protein n=1 Tax=Pseudoalteromonas umbrosa TaxID=3048489 RepID=UPI0024C38745|nr:CBS domain-containing protein [Pseudoalteromonas sp. B95]MDK1288794.1 CBS domain-containing protein [Pseudoalteromonas sp. B95]
MLHTVEQLMTPDPLAVKSTHTLHDAHNLMREKNIRHIPVIDDDGHLVGMLTQKIMIAKVMNILSTYGNLALERKEKQEKVSEVMAEDFVSVTPSQSLHEVVTYFVENRHGCMPVVDEHKKLLGILTSSDFVRLAAALLS